MKNMPTQKLTNLIKPGEIYQLGNHRLMCSSASDQESVTKLIGQDKIRLIACDPPYGCAYVESKSGFAQNLSKPKEIANDQIQSNDEYKTFSKNWLSLALPFLDKKNSIYIFNSDIMLFALKQAMDEIGIHFSQLLIWVKNQAVVGRKDYLPQHELIIFAWFGTHLFTKSKDKSVIFCPKPSSSKSHPTQKPLSLMRQLILNSSKIGDYVYDPFGGSGTTLLSCEQTKRKCLMIELDPEYCQTIIERFEKLTGLKAKKLN